MESRRMVKNLSESESWWNSEGWLYFITYLIYKMYYKVEVIYILLHLYWLCKMLSKVKAIYVTLSLKCFGKWKWFIFHGLFLFVEHIIWEKKWKQFIFSYLWGPRIGADEDETSEEPSLGSGAKCARHLSTIQPIVDQRL